MATSLIKNEEEGWSLGQFNQSTYSTQST